MMWTESIALAAVTSVVTAVVTVLLHLMSALVERTSPIRLRHWALELYEQPMRFEVFRFLIGLLAKLSALALLISVLPLYQRGGRPLLASVLTVAMILAITELINRSLVGRDPEGALRRLTQLYRLGLTVLTPLIAISTPLLPGAILERREDDEDGATDDEIEAFISVGTQEGILEPGEGRLIQGVIDFGDTLVRSVVTPRIDMVCAPVESDLETLAELFLSSRHSRIPIYQDSVDQIVGILHIRDLFRGIRENEPPSVLELTIEPYFVPEAKPLRDLLREFQALRQQVAIVVDEYGGTAGLVSVEDLLEEIVGEIEDEHDEAQPENERLEDGSWRVDGRASLETLDDLFDVEVEEETYETVGGLIFGTLGYVTEPGETVDCHGLVLEVESVEGRRIKSVIVSRAEKMSQDDV
ncbi:MAG: hemolysin family protein [Acidobacteriota bacterium]